MAQQTKNLFGLAGIPLVMVLGNSMLIPILPTMESRLHLTSFQSSFVITAFSIAAGIVIPFAGYFSDRFNRKIVIAIALVLYGAGGLIAGLAALWMKNPYMVIIAGRVLQGIGAAGTSPIAMALVGDLFQGAAESRALGLLETSNGLGKVLSPIFGSLLALIAWYTVFLAFPVICGAVLLVFLFLVKEKKPYKQPRPVKEYMQSIKHVFQQNGRWLVPAFFIGSICLFTLFGVLFYLSDLLEDTYGIDGVPKGGVLAIPLLAMSVTAYFTGAVIKKKLTLMRLFVVIGMFALAASYLIASFVKNVWLLIGILAIGSIGTGMILPCLNSMIIGAVKKAERGMITSLYNGVRFIGVAIGPPVFTWLLGMSARVMFDSIAALTAGFALIGWIFIKPGQPQTAEASAGQGKGRQGGQEQARFVDEQGLRDTMELLGIQHEDPAVRQEREGRKRLGFDVNDLVDQLLGKEKGKGK